MTRFIVVAACLLVARTAFADAESMTVEADARFKEGVALAKQGRYEDARAKYIEVLALAPTAKVLLNLAVVEEASGHPREALQHARLYAANPHADPAKVETVNRELIPELYAKTGHVRLRADAGADIVIDGTEHYRAPVVGIIDVMPGSHAVEVGDRHASLDVPAGAEREMDVRTPEVRAVAPPDGRGNHSIVVSESNGRTMMTVASISSFALAAVGAGIAIGAGVAAQGRTNDGNTLQNELFVQYGPSACATTSDPRCGALLSARSDASALTGIAVAAGVIGAALAATGVVLFVLRPSKQYPAAPEVHAGVGHLSLSWSF